MNIETLQRAIALAGSTKKFAQLLGISEQAVGRWKNKYKGRVPAGRVLSVFQVTGVTRMSCGRIYIHAQLMGSPRNNNGNK